MNKRSKAATKGDLIVVVRVDVTEDDIKEGIRLQCWDCPVALAIRRVTGEKCAIAGTRVYYTERSLSLPTMSELPRGVQRWVVQYDTGHHVQPLSFVLNYPAIRETAS